MSSGKVIHSRFIHNLREVKNMNKILSKPVADLISKISWDHRISLGNASAETILGKNTPFRFFLDLDPEAFELTEAMIQNLEGFFSFTDKDVEKIKNPLWEDCLSACTGADYGFDEIEGNTHAENNLIGMNILNKEDAYANVVFTVTMSTEDGEEFLPNRYYVLDSQSVRWEQENGVAIIIKNDNIIAAYNASPYFSQYE